MSNYLRDDGSLPPKSWMIEKSGAGPARKQSMWPVVWEHQSGRTHLMIPLLRTDEYGDEILYIDDPYNYHLTDRSTAISLLDSTWDSWLHLGLVPQRPGRLNVRASPMHETDEISRLRGALGGQSKETQVAVANATRATEIPISWILDSGSGHDIISKQKVESHRGNWTPMTRGLDLNTVGGHISATHSIPMLIKEIMKPFMLSYSQIHPTWCHWVGYVSNEVSASGGQHILNLRCLPPRQARHCVALYTVIFRTLRRSMVVL